MVRAVGHQADVRQRIGVMPLVTTAQNLAIKFQVVLKGVAGSAQTDDRPPGCDILFYSPKLRLRQSEPARKDDHQVRGLKRLQTWEIIRFVFSESALADCLVARFQISLEGCQ